MNNPIKEHMEAVYQILRYLKRSLRKGLLFRKTEYRDMILYSDAYWSGSQIDSRSTIGYCSFVWVNLVTWQKLRALVVTIWEGIWIR
ncbi:Retrovirus-related Pol polyprotein from transposon TNT 1-94 [Gossypium australe]|uniref:Retrovirus-related Pol polyprotein from transposon TNT 1-94 n=1 Tax=Gossypium australe TaxID=47621 RepID=A0A5B6W8D5_9ROSI|nr:Retrovirus-related Pol polyprotein from transposon TNT 1-94 [Gossypium australe]